MASTSPVQVVLNADDFRTVRENPGGGGPHKDFFAERDGEFARHRAGLIAQLSSVRDALAAQPSGPMGYARVTLRRSALAKTHRPLVALFKEDRAPLVGGDDLGQMIVELTPEVIDLVTRDVSEAEMDTRWTERDGKRLPDPSRRRSEVGAIARIERHGSAERRRFSVKEAIDWLRNGRTGGGYRVELFRELPVASSATSGAAAAMFESFRRGLASIGPGLDLRRLPSRTGAPTLSVRLGRSAAQGELALGDDPQSAVRALAPIDESAERHGALLAFLEGHPLVRRVALPSVLAPSDVAPRRIVPPSPARIPEPAEGRRYPRVGVIDGGLGAALDSWVLGRSGLLGDADRDGTHGSFIGGLLVAGRSLNTDEIATEPDGCQLFDLDLFPRDEPNDDTNFRRYYGAAGVLGFFEEVGNSVAQCRADHGVRIYNLSINVVSPVQADRYSEEAQALDRIAEENDAIVVISAGNLPEGSGRPEWASDPTRALAQLAAARDDGIQVPAESARNVSVAALNAPGLAHCVAHAPALYSRRGPGLRAGAKPDFGHAGGAGTSRCELGSGLFSIGPDGTVLADCGTSFAAPFVAKTLAALDAQIEERMPREVLLALAVHRATLPEPLRHDVLSGVARQLTGFGQVPSADEILVGDDHSITLVFHSRLMAGQQLEFGFSWPASLVRGRGSCRGRTRLTLVATPPLDHRYGAEFVRVNMEAKLQQYCPDKNDGRGGWEGRAQGVYLPHATDHQYESDLVEHGLKWNSTKVYAGDMPRGVGKSSDWRLVVGYQTRAREVMPEAGVQFAAILTIEDPKGEKPIFTELRQAFQSRGVRVADIRSAVRVGVTARR